MADRFFLFSKDDDSPLVELLGLASSHEFMALVKKVGEDPDLASTAWGLMINNDIPDDAGAVSIQEVGYEISKALMRRLLRYENPRPFNVTIVRRDNDPERLRVFLHQAWEV